MAYESIFITEINKRCKDGYAPQKAIISYFLNLYFRLDYGDERDFICDSSGDKGIDAIFVDDDGQELYFIQSKFSYKDAGTNTLGFDSNKFIGDAEPKEFLGSFAQFQTKEQIEAILAHETTSSELKTLLLDLDIADKIETYHKRPIYITTRYIGEHTEALMSVNPELEFFTPIEFEQEYNRYTSVLSGKMNGINLSFSPVGNVIHAPHNSIICMIKVLDLVNIQGIEDYSVFDKNVRSWLGRNKVYKSIKQNLRDTSFDQANNILMHNGITIVGSDVNFDTTNNIVNANNISIVNGCQSTFAYYDNKTKVNENNTVLVKIIPQDQHEEKLGKDIVLYSNTQSQVKTSDLVSLTDQAKVIQKKFDKSTLWCLKIRDGYENIDCNGKQIIKLAELAQYVASFYNVGNIVAANKNKLLENSFYEVFNRNLDLEHYELVLKFTQIINKVIKEVIDKGTESEKTLLHSYFLTKLFILNVLKKIYTEVHSIKIYELPSFNDKIMTDEYYSLIEDNINNIIIEIDSYLTTNGKLNIYKNILKNKEKSEEMSQEILKEYKKQIRKDSSTSLDFT